MRARLILLAALAPLGVRAETPTANLMLRLKAGQTQSYRITTDTTLKTTLPGGDVRTTNNRTVDTFDLAVDRVNPDGSYAVRVKRLTHKLVVDGEETAGTEVNGAEATATLTADGRYTGISPAPKPRPDGLSGSTPEDFLSTVFDDEVGQPTHLVAVGERWQDMAESPVDPQQPKVTIHSRLVGIDDLDGKRVGRVLRIIAEKVHAPAPADEASSGGTLQAGGFCTTDLASGLPLDERDVLQLKMNVTMPNGGQTVRVGSDALIRVHIEALPAA